MRSVTHTRYILALSAGEVPGEVRSAYLEDMKEVERGAPLLGVILSTTTKAVLDKQMTAADARRLVQEEYAAWELEKTLGDYSLYEPLADAFFEPPGDRAVRLERCKRITDAAKDADRTVKDGVYLGVVSTLSAVWMVLRDIAYAREVTDYAANADERAYGAEIFRTLTETVLSAQTAEDGR